MKKNAMINPVKTLASLFLLAVFLFSCEKVEDIPEQTFEDIFDSSGLNNLNQTIENATSIEELAILSEDENLEVPEELVNMELDEMISHFENNLRLTSDEVDMLLKNDNETFIKVIDRFGSVPGELSSEDDFASLEASPFSKFLLSQKTETVNFYGGDCYSAVLALQEQIRNDVINPLKKVEELTFLEVMEELKSANGHGKGNKYNGKNKHEVDIYKYIMCHYCRHWWWIIWQYWLQHHHFGGWGYGNGHH